MTISELCTDALREIGVVNAVDAPSPEDAALALFRLNAILDNWNAERRAVYAETISTFTLVPGTNPHTIGPTASTWTVTQRPESIEAANLILSGGIRQPITLRDAQWWMNRADPTLSEDQPTDLYYEPAWPLGNAYFWPAPGSALQVELLIRVVLSSVALGDTFTMPPGYQSALTKSLAEDLVAPFKVPMPVLLPRQAEKARARVWGANAVIPRLYTNDAGIPGGGRSTWDYRTGRTR